MSATKIAYCRCEHPWQDAAHGWRRRVHNRRKDGGGRCTVCGEIKAGMFDPATTTGGKK